MGLAVVLAVAAVLADSGRCIPIDQTAGGLLYLNGHRVEAPYRLTGRGVITADTLWQALYLNGYEVWRAPIAAASADTSGTTLASRRMRLMMRAAADVGARRAAGDLTDPMQRTRALVERYRADRSLVRSADVESDHAYLVHWRGDREPERYVISGDPVVPRSRGDVDARDEARAIMRMLATGGLVLIEGDLHTLAKFPDGLRWQGQIDSLTAGRPVRSSPFISIGIAVRFTHQAPLPSRGCED